MKPVMDITDTNEQKIIKVAESQPQYQTLPSIFVDNGNICISRWACEDEEEILLLKTTRQIFLYIMDFQTLPPFLLSASLHSEGFLTESYSELKGVRIRRTVNRKLFQPIPEVAYTNQIHKCYLWNITDRDLGLIKASNWSFWVYQLNFKQPITPYLVSLYENQSIV